MVNPKISSRRFPVIAAAAAASLAASAGFAQTAVTWQNLGTGSYTDPANWNPNVTPSNSGGHFLMIANGGTAQVTVADTAAEGAFLNLGMQPGETGRLEISGGTLTLGELRVGGRETVPNPSDPLNPTPNGGGTGTVVQSGGTINVNFTTGTEPPIQSMYVGDSGLASGNTGNGRYEITAGALNVGINADDHLAIGTGSGTVGTFIQQGGDVASTGRVTVARRGASASYTMSGGTLKQLGNVDGLFIAEGANAAATGSAGTTLGTFTQTNGDVDVAVGVEVGRRSGTGIYNMSGGTLDITGQMILGGNGGSSVASLLSSNGTFNLSGTAAVTIGTNFNVGLSSASVANTGQGTFNMSGGTLQLKGASAIWAIGNGNATTGNVDFSGGTITMNGATSNIDLGRNNGTGLLRIRDNASLTARQLTVNSGSTAGASREVRIEGGNTNLQFLTFGTVASQSNRQLNISGGDIHIGQLTTGQATGAGQALTNISGYNTLDIDTLEIFTGSRFKASTNVTLDSVTTYGNATVETTAGNTLTFNAPGSFGTGATRTLTKVGPGTMTVNAPQSYFASSVLTNNEGTVNLNSTINGNLTVNANAATNFGANAKLNAINVGAVATATLLNDGSANRVITTASGTPPGVTINATGRLDLKNNKLITNVGPGSASGGIYSGVQKEVQRAYDFGAWDQPGLTTSESDAVAGLTTIGVATGAQIRGLGATDTDTFAGQTINSLSTIAMYTYAGDANLDGTIDGGDYGIIDNFVQVPGADSYANGDFNYDGVIDGGDYGIIDNNIQAQGAPFPTSGSAVAASSAGLSGVTAVPEPSAFGFAMLASAGLLRRRRRCR